MRIIVVVDLAKQVSERVVNEGLQPDYKKIRQKLPSGIESIYCGGHNGSSANVAHLIALDYSLKIRIDKHLEDIEKLGKKMNKADKKQPLQQKIHQQETVSHCMFHLQEYISSMKIQKQNNILIVSNEFGCQLLLTYALGISIDAVHAFNINAGSVILLDIHDMTAMNKIHF